MNIKLTDSRKDRFKEIIRFIVSGGVSFVVDYGIMIFLTEKLKVYYLVSTGISFTVSVAVNYIMSVLWVFENTRKKSVMSIVIFVGSSIVGLFLNELIMWIIVDKFGIYYMVSKIFSTLIVMVWNYVMKKKAISIQTQPT